MEARFLFISIGNQLHTSTIPTLHRGGKSTPCTYHVDSRNCTQDLILRRVLDASTLPLSKGSSIDEFLVKGKSVDLNIYNFNLLHFELCKCPFESIEVSKSVARFLRLAILVSLTFPFEAHK